MTEQLEEGITQVKNIIRMEDYDLTEAGARLLVTIEQLIENLEYVNCHLDYLGQAQDKNKDTTWFNCHLDYLGQAQDKNKDTTWSIMDFFSK